jgi:glycosyltransferase involved in cell wall biosynthesis
LKRILLISDVKGWGGWVRAEYIKKYLSDEFDFTLMDATEFNKLEKSTSVIPYDLVYLLFHTMLNKKTVQRLLHSNIKVVTIVTGFPTLKPIFYGRNGNKEKARKTFLKVANRCKAIFANNYKSLEDLRYIYNPRKTYYMPRGVDPKVFFPMTREFIRKNDEDTFTIAYVGKPVPEKGLREFIMPACEIANVRIIFNDRNFENALPPEEMNRFYNKADAYIVASTIDGTPNPALEAASCGKPIISNKIGNMPEFIVDGHNGFLLDEMEINKYAKILMWMKRNQKRSFEMGLNGRKTIEESWTWEKVLNKHERQVFRRILC